MTHDTLCQCGAMTAEDCGTMASAYCGERDEDARAFQEVLTEHRPLMDALAKKSGAVFRPNHYKRLTIDPVTFIGANNLPFDIGNIIKYVCRFDAKNGRDDILKARRYCDIVLERLDREARIAAGEDPNDVWKSIL